VLFLQDDEKGSTNKGYEIRQVQNIRERMEILTVTNALGASAQLKIVEKLGLTYFVDPVMNYLY